MPHIAANSGMFWFEFAAVPFHLCCFVPAFSVHRLLGQYIVSLLKGTDPIGGLCCARAKSFSSVFLRMPDYCVCVRFVYVFEIVWHRVIWCVPHTQSAWEPSTRWPCDCVWTVTIGVQVMISEQWWSLNSDDRVVSVAKKFVRFEIQLVSSILLTYLFISSCTSYSMIFVLWSSTGDLRPEHQELIGPAVVDRWSQTLGRFLDYRQTR